jgi:hypothetical protein
MVHLMEGAFLPPKETQPQQQQQQQQQDAATAGKAVAAPTVGLGSEAREFVIHHLPLFKVPWRIVSQLEAAAISGLRLITPVVLRPLMKRLGERDRPADEPHPFASLTPLQALQLLEFCCSDLITADRNASSSSSSIQRPTAAAAAVHTTADVPPPSPVSSAAAGGGGGEVALPASLTNNLPEGAVTAVRELLGQVGVAALRGISNQLQQQVLRGIDDVINNVIDAMNDPQRQQQQQQQQHTAGTAAPSVEASAADPAGSSSAGGSEQQLQKPPLNLHKVHWLKGLPIPTAANTIAVLGSSNLYVYPGALSGSSSSSSSSTAATAVTAATAASSDNFTNRLTPPSLLPAHLQHQFVSEECVAALEWAFKDAYLRQELRLVFYDFSRLAAHLQEALGPTWDFLGSQGSSSHQQRLTLPAAAMPASQAARGAGGMPRKLTGIAGPAAAVQWNDGASGGPYLEWLQQLWRVILQLIAAAPAWGENESGNSSGSVARSGSGNTAAAAARLTGGIFSAAERARGLGRGLAEALAAELSGQRTAAGDDSSSAEEDELDTAAAAAAAATAALWQPLDDWPLLPLADGRLLRVKHRGLILAVLAEYYQDNSGSNGSRGGDSIARASEKGSWVSSPVLQAVQCPLCCCGYECRSP